MSDGNREVWLGMGMREGIKGAQKEWGALDIRESPWGDIWESSLPGGLLQFAVHPTPSPVSGVPGFGADEVLLVAALEISGLCETVVSEVSPSNPPHTPAPSVRRIRRQLVPPEQ